MTCRDPTGGSAARAVGSPTGRSRPGARAGGFTHAALLYHDEAERLGAVVDLLRAAARDAAPVHAAVPADILRLARGRLTMPPPEVYETDMADLGRNPARLIAAARSFADDHPGAARITCLWEPASTPRSPAEACELARHEALCNLAFTGQPVSILCLYAAANLDDHLIRNAEQTHPAIIAGGHQQISPTYLGPGRFPAGCDDPLPDPRPSAQSLRFGQELRPVRAFAARHARSAGLAPDRASDLILAVSELAANTIAHSASGGVIRAWSSSTELICQMEDAGHITDPLAGRRRQPADAYGGHGLWLVNQVCDLVETRSGPAGTTTRLHMRRPETPAARSRKPSGS
jgi:anti-sigma regulatory factor (Ser/Thr protein kinase)